MEKVRAKFKVETKTENQSGFIVDLKPVVSGSVENEQFYKYTPGGTVSLSTVNKAAAEYFAVGREYYIDFIEVPD
jgi:hypothetical protein